jgi:hypothetical protein
VTPQEHYNEAERWLNLLDTDATGNDWCQMVAQVANAHATLAVAGFTRDATMKAEDYTGWTSPPPGPPSTERIMKP